jgi:hypothetical protein
VFPFGTLCTVLGEMGRIEGCRFGVPLACRPTPALTFRPRALLFNLRLDRLALSFQVSPGQAAHASDLLVNRYLHGGVL